MKRSMVFAYPLFMVGLFALSVGLYLQSYWPMALGLVTAAGGALNWSMMWLREGETPTG